MPQSILSPEVQSTFERARVKQSRTVAVGNQTVSIPVPFPSPPDWRDQWIYFLLVDRFNNPAAPPRFLPFDGAHGVFQGGTFNGVREQLDYLKQLGVGAIWLSPVHKNCAFSPFTFHGYGFQNFLEIEPRFASAPELAETELQALIDAAHARGIYVIFDIVLNHAGDVFEYVFADGRRAAEADYSDHPYTINWRDIDGQGRPEWTQAPPHPPADAAVWPTELRNNEFFRRKGRGGELGGDFSSLKELITDVVAFSESGGRHFPVRNTLIRAFQYLIAKFDVDGFRIDTLKYIEPEFARIFGNAIREYALSIGKKNFFTFGEVFDNEEQIARFIGRNTTEDSDQVGVDAALDFPLFFVLPAVAKGLAAPSIVVNTFEHRKHVQRSILTSHGEASRYFVTFLDNHDMRNRFYFSPADDPRRYEDQLLLGVTCLFALQGIPCLYYGTEQGLHGAGHSDAAVRESLWGKVSAFDRAGTIYAAISALAALRAQHPSLRYGRQYFRPLSGNGVTFGVSAYAPGVLAWSRLLNEEEVVIIANTSVTEDFFGEVIVDFALNPAGSPYEIIYSNKTFRGPNRGGAMPGRVLAKAGGQVMIHEPNGTISNGPARAVKVTLKPMEAQILRRQP